MRISERQLRKIIREELVRENEGMSGGAAVSSRVTPGSSQFIYPADLTVGMSPEQKRAQNAARDRLINGAKALGFTEAQAMWAAGQGWQKGSGRAPGKNASTWISAAQAYGAASPQAKAAAMGTVLEGVDDESLDELLKVVMDAYSLLDTPPA
jgi:hypothetical protein